MHRDLSSARDDASPTAALLWAASRPAVDRGEVERALARGPDLEQAAALAVAQRVSPLLWRALLAAESVGPGATDEPWVEELRADHARCRAQAALVLPRLAAAALGPLAAGGFEPIVMKGAALAGRYPEPGLRPMDDVDILVPRRQHDSALRRLEAAGWRRVDIPGRHHETVLTHAEVPGLPLELHRGFAVWSERANRLSSARLWARRQPCSIGGAPAFTFTPEDELVALACHAAKPFHVFGRLIWITDLAVVASAAERAGRPLDWDRVLALTAQARSRTAVAVALTLSSRIGLSAPAELCRPAAGGTRMAALAPVLSPEWPVTERDDGVRNRLRYALVDDSRLRVALLGDSVVDGGRHAGFVRATARTGVALARRWWQLRRSALEQRGEDLGHPVEP